MRSSITGTTASPVAPWRSTRPSVSSGSKRRRITTVQVIVAEIASWPNPQAWNIGAVTTVVCSARQGMRSSIDASAAAPPLPDRRAPLGVPVVPDVSRMVLPLVPGLAGTCPRCASIRASTVGPRGEPSVHATTSTRSGTCSLACSTMAANSSSYTISCASSRARTSVSCGPEKPVFSSSAFAPSLAAALSASTKPRWLRHRIAMVRVRPSVSSAIPAASALLRASSSAQVRAPRSSMIAVACGRRAAARPIPVIAVTPWRRTTAAIRRYLSGRSGAIIPLRTRMRTTNHHCRRRRRPLVIGPLTRAPETVGHAPARPASPASGRAPRGPPRRCPAPHRTPGARRSARAPW